MRTNNFYNKNLRPYAGDLRSTMTKAEVCLWKFVLKNRQLKGYQFNRQRPVLNYIADFMCKELKLIIEVDGITHTYDGALEKDNIRQKALEDAGFTVLRLTDDQVLNRIGWVYDFLEEWIEKAIIPLPPSKGDK